jgi:hypothetical protein
MTRSGQSVPANCHRACVHFHRESATEQNISDTELLFSARRRRNVSIRRNGLKSLCVDISSTMASRVPYAT